jgi:hypothetical protein
MVAWVGRNQWTSVLLPAECPRQAPVGISPAENPGRARRPGLPGGTSAARSVADVDRPPAEAERRPHAAGLPAALIAATTDEAEAEAGAMTKVVVVMMRKEPAAASGRDALLVLKQRQQRPRIRHRAHDHRLVASADLDIMLRQRIGGNVRIGANLVGDDGLA